MPKASKPPRSTKHRNDPYTITDHPTTPPAPAATEHTSSAAWSPEADKRLMLARQQNHAWQAIATTHFPDKSPNACRKHYERLMEKRNVADSWDGPKMEALGKAYIEYREEMWRKVADRMKENWQTVETKVCSSSSHHSYNSTADDLPSAWKKALEHSEQPLVKPAVRNQTITSPVPRETAIIPILTRAKTPYLPPAPQPPILLVADLTTMPLAWMLTLHIPLVLWYTGRNRARLNLHHDPIHRMAL
ncbi:MAG: hypothetical protein Q9163_006534 [Psora crenata]